MRIRKLILGAVAAVAGTAFVGSARADIAIQLSEDGGAYTTVLDNPVDFTLSTFTGAYGDFVVAANLALADNGATLSDLLGSTVSIKNANTLTPGTHTLAVRISETDYSLPPGASLNMESGMGGSVVMGTTLGLSGIFQGYEDSSNTLFGVGGFTTGSQNATMIGTTFATGSATGVFTRSGLYSLTSTATLKLSAGGQVNYGNHINVTAVPLPATASTGLALFAGLGALVGIRKLASRRSIA